MRSTISSVFGHRRVSVQLRGTRSRSAVTLCKESAGLGISAWW